MNGAAILEVTHKIDVQVLQGSLGLEDRIEVEQALGWMHVGTITGIDDRHWSYLAGVLGCTLDEVAHGDDVGVVAHHQNGVLQRFALGGAGCLGIREADDTGAKAIGSCLETELGTSRWFEEKGRYDLSLQQLPVGMLFKLLRHFEEVHDFLLREVGNRHKIMFFHTNFD